MSSDSIIIKDIPNREVVSSECKGPWSQLPEKISLLDDFIKTHNLAASGHTSAIFYNTPKEVSIKDLKWEVLKSLSSHASMSTKEWPGFTIKEMLAKRVAIIIYRGTLRDAGDAYDTLGRWIRERGFTILGPSEEVYLSDLKDTRSEAVIEIRLPVL